MKRTVCAWKSPPPPCVLLCELPSHCLKPAWLQIRLQLDHYLSLACSTAVIASFQRAKHTSCTLRHSNTIKPIIMSATFLIKIKDKSEQKQHTSGGCNIWSVRLPKPHLAKTKKKLIKLKWSKARDQSESPWQPICKNTVLSCEAAQENSQFIKDTHQTLALGLCVLHAQEDISFSTFKGILIFWKRRW